MIGTLRSLALGIALIIGAACVLLFSDLGSRVANGASAVGDIKRAAVLQHASQAVLDEGAKGLIDGLAEAGYVEGRNLELRKFNAQGDVTVSNAIAGDMANGDSDILLTISTVSLQAVANANRDSRKNHVFALVTKPSATGVGISATDPLDHPTWMAGYGTMQPIENAFRLAKEMNPALSQVGVVWNAAEANSEAQLVVARNVCADLGIQLMEATIDASAAVGEAAGALVARGAEALFIPGDVMVMVAADTLIAAASKGDIPVFSVIPPNVEKGALFDLGADYYQVGRHAGKLAGEILSGRDPATVGITNYLPEELMLNEQALAVVAAKGWSFSESVSNRAQAVVNAKGVLQPGPAARSIADAPPRRAKPWNLQAIVYSESPPAEDTLEGLAAGMKSWSLKEGTDYTFRVRNAQGDVAALSGIVDAALTDGADIIIPISTPSLQATLQKARDLPVVFSMVANPMAAGAANSYEDHLPNVTGVTVFAPADDLLDLLVTNFPTMKRIGTLFCPAEANSVDLKDYLVKHAGDRGLEVVTVAANSSAELADAATSLAGRPIDAIVQISDNLTSAGFSAITQAARQGQKPLFSLNSTTIALGSPVAFGRDYFNTGEETAAVLEQVMNGESPADIPIRLSPKIIKAASLPNAQAVGMELPAGFLDQMQTVIRD